MTPKICLSEEQLSYLEFCYNEVIKKKIHLKTYLFLMFAEKYPNLKLSHNTLKRRCEEYIQHKMNQLANSQKKPPVIINNLQENNKLDCFYGQKSFRLGKMYNKRFFQINKEKIIQIRNVRKESAVKEIRVTKLNYYSIN
jgi:hypothetical protein